MITQKDVEVKLTVLVAGLKDGLSTIRTNRPSPRLVENISVQYLGAELTIRQLGSISIVPPREIDVSCWDKGAVPAVAAAIEKSGLGLTANVDGGLIRIYLPALTDERRNELVKFAKSITESTRIKIRNVRDDLNKQIEGEYKMKAITEDQKFKTREQVQKSVDKFNGEAETLLSQKIKEISE